MKIIQRISLLLLIINSTSLNLSSAYKVNDKKIFELDIHKTDGHLDASIFNKWFPADLFKSEIKMDYYGKTKVNGPFQFDLSDFQIKSVSDNVFSEYILSSSLYLDHNNITEIPLGVFDNQEKLEILYLQNNNIKSLDKQLLADLTKLEVLNLENNKLSALDGETFETLVALKELYICSNSLKYLDRSMIKPLKNLEIFHVAKNEITAIEERFIEEFNQLCIRNASFSENNCQIFTQKNEFGCLMITSTNCWIYEYEHLKKHKTSNYFNDPDIDNEIENDEIVDQDDQVDEEELNNAEVPANVLNDDIYDYSS